MIKTTFKNGGGPGMRFLFYSHDGLGLGHTRRHLALATALTELAPAASVLLVSGADDVHRLGLPDNVEVIKLPCLRKVANDHYVSRPAFRPAAGHGEILSPHSGPGGQTSLGRRR
jgi:predicted glycosyltransferase